MEEKAFDELCHNVRDLIQDIRDAVVFLAEDRRRQCDAEEAAAKKKVETDAVAAFRKRNKI